MHQSTWGAYETYRHGATCPGSHQEVQAQHFGARCDRLPGVLLGRHVRASVDCTRLCEVWILLLSHFSGEPRPREGSSPQGAPGGRPGLVVWPHKQLAEQAVLVAWEDTLTFQLGQETAGSWGLLGPGWLGTAFWRGVQVSQIVGDGGELFMSLPRHWGFRSDPIGATSQSEN